MRSDSRSCVWASMNALSNALGHGAATDILVETTVTPNYIMYSFCVVFRDSCLIPEIKFVCLENRIVGVLKRG